MYPDETEYPDIPLLRDLTFSTLNEWETKLTNSTGGNWNMTSTEYPFSEHGDKTTDDYPDCNVFINYTQGTEDESVGRTGFDFSQSSRYYYWIEIDLYTVERKIHVQLGEGFNNSTISDTMNWRLIPDTDIRNIVLHEFGHGLGLEHYYVTVDCRVEVCDYSPIMFGSIDVFENEIKSVTEKDLKMTIRVYGEDGFGHPTPKWIPRSCDLQCLEVDCGNSRMC